MTVKVGDAPPDAQFLDAEGKPASARDYAGRVLVLYFYPKDDTSGCTREAQDFSALADEFRRAGATVVGVSKDTIKKHAKFIEKHDLKVALGSDEAGAVCEAFGVWVEKSLYGRKYMGIERATFLIGKDCRIARIWRKVKVPGHAAEVLDAVHAL